MTDSAQRATQDPILASEAHRAGVARAEADLATLPPDDGCVSVSVGGYPEREYFKVCQTCTRPPGRCTCERG